MAKSIADLAVKLSLDSQGLTSGLTGAGKQLNGFGGGLAQGGGGRPTPGLDKITGGFSSMQKELGQLQLAMRPDLLAKQANLENKLTQARAAHAKALGAAKSGGLNADSLTKGIGAASGGLGGMIEGLGAAAGPAGMAIAATVGAVIGLTKAAFDLAKAANPALAEQFDAAWDDMMASLGQSFVPMLQDAIPLVRALGDAFSVFAPILQGMLKMAMHFSGIAGLSWLAKAGGLNGQSTGAAGRNASFTSADSFAEKAYAKAFSQPGGSPAEQQVDITTKIFGFLQEKWHDLTGKPTETVHP